MDGAKHIELAAFIGRTPVRSAAGSAFPTKIDCQTQKSG